MADFSYAVPRRVENRRAILSRRRRGQVPPGQPFAGDPGQGRHFYRPLRSFGRIVHYPAAGREGIPYRNERVLVVYCQCGQRARERRAYLLAVYVRGDSTRGLLKNPELV